MADARRVRTPRQGAHAIVALVAIASCVCAPTTSHAQELASEVPGGPSLERRQQLYDEAKLNPRTGMLYSAALPGLGNLYADRIFRGVLWMGVFGMSAFCTAAGVVLDDRRLTIVGASGIVSSYAGSLTMTYFDVRSFNEELRQRYKVPAQEERSLRLAPPVGVGFTWRF